MINKDTIKRSFSKAAHTYDSSSEVQKEVVLELSDFIRGFAPEDNFVLLRGGSKTGPPLAVKDRTLILDIGCGTGSLTSSIKEELPAASVYGCDIAVPMLLKAGENLGWPLRAAAADMEELPFPDSSFDMVVSSLTYQWALDARRAFGEAVRVLKRGGLFAFSTLGKQTLHELKKSFKEARGMVLSGHKGVKKEPVRFLNAGELRSCLSMAGFEVMEVKNHLRLKRYKDLRALLNTLKNVGALPNVKDGGAGFSKAVVFKKAEGIYKQRFAASNGDGIMATYDVILAAARKV